jgi:hypothetical protein
VSVCRMRTAVGDVRFTRLIDSRAEHLRRIGQNFRRPMSWDGRPARLNRREPRV